MYRKNIFFIVLLFFLSCTQMFGQHSKSFMIIYVQGYQLNIKKKSFNYLKINTLESTDIFPEIVNLKNLPIDTAGLFKNSYRMGKGSKDSIYNKFESVVEVFKYLSEFNWKLVDNYFSLPDEFGTDYRICNNDLIHIPNFNTHFYYIFEKENSLSEK